MQNQLFISVVVPVHNGAAHLGRCLDALLASQYKAFEIIVSDDASTDASVAICTERGVACVRGTVRSGPAAARNAGAKAARGDNPYQKIAVREALANLRVSGYE